jgi:cathepsin D/cathepsin E
VCSSGTFWVPSKECKAAGCNERAPFDDSASSTFAEDPDGDRFSIKYGSGSVDGKVVIDDMLIGGIQLPEARIGVVTTEVGSAFENAAFSGLVGMAYPTLARAGMHPVFDQMIEKKLMKNNRFTFFMSNDADQGKSGIWFDDVPQALYKGKLKKHPVISKNYWSVRLFDIKVDGKSTGVCPNGCKAAIDSGTSLLTAPTTMARTVLDAVSKGKQSSATQLLDVGTRAGCQPIKDAPTLTYVLEAEDANGNKSPMDYDLAPEDYMLEEGVGCGRAAVSSLDVPKPNGPVVILGDIFMSKYLSVFDRDADAVYIGKANQASDKSMMFTDQPTDALLEEAKDVEADNWTEISAVSY